ncbi:unnamed protein product [Amoebophrya sp. A25]|nr:unnamed protein product [Amoebophrya sp. A25]|eukprot:GSA25T00005964001.1
MVASASTSNSTKSPTSTCSPAPGGSSPLLLVCVLRAGFFVHADVYRMLKFECLDSVRTAASTDRDSTDLKNDFDITADWVRVSTYNKQSIKAGIEGSQSSFLMDLSAENSNLQDRDVVLLDDSIGRGRSMRLLTDLFKPRGVKTCFCAALLTPVMDDQARQQSLSSSSRPMMLLGSPPAPPLFARQLPRSLGPDPFSRIGGYGNDAVTKYRSLPFIGLLQEQRRDAIWSEDTISGGIDYRLFAHPASAEFIALRGKCSIARGQLHS